MKKLQWLLTAVIVVLIVVASILEVVHPVHAQAQTPTPTITILTPFGPVQTTTPTNPSVISKGVLMPTDQTIYCSLPQNVPVCNALTAFAQMYQGSLANPPIAVTAAGIAQIFTANKIVVTDAGGNNISPYKP